MKTITNIRFAAIKDLPAITNICNQAIAAGNANAFTNRLTVEQLTDWFEDHSPDTFPLYVIESGGMMIGWGSLSPYRKARKGFRNTAEISYYLDYKHLGVGYGKMLIRHMLDDCSRLNIKSVMAIMLDINPRSARLLEKFGFTRWGHLPRIANLNGNICGQWIYGKNMDQRD
jgi:L-amino acid N-acyltransferase YncA